MLKDERKAACLQVIEQYETGLIDLMVAAAQFGREEITGSPLRGGQRINTAAEDARRRAVTEFERWQRRAVSNIDSLNLFATLKEAYPLICMVQKCLLACPPSQSDCEELFSLLGLYKGIFMYVCI